MRPGGARDRGTAALELALVMTLVLAVVVLVAPLAVAFVERLRLERAAGQVVRYVTAATPEGRHDTAADAEAEAGRAWTANGGDAGVGVTLQKASGVADCPTRRATTVTLSAPLDLGAFAGLMGLFGPAPSLHTMTATATSCEE